MAIVINGIHYTWHDLEFSAVVDGAARLILADLTAVNYGHRVVVTNVYGAGRKPTGQSVGSYQLDSTTLEFNRVGWQTLRDTLPTQWLGSQFSLTINYRHPNEDLQTVEIQGRLMGLVSGLSQGDDPIRPTVEFMPSLILENGEEVVPDTLPG